MKRSEYASYLRTLRRIPAEIRLSMATREFDMHDADMCITGWAIREALLRAFGTMKRVPGMEVDGVKQCDPEASIRAAQTLYGGTREEWARIFWGVDGKDAQGNVAWTSELPAIETAFTLAVAEAVYA